MALSMSQLTLPPGSEMHVQQEASVVAGCLSGDASRGLLCRATMSRCRGHREHLCLGSRSWRIRQPIGRFKCQTLKVHAISDEDGAQTQSLQVTDGDYSLGRQSSQALSGDVRAAFFDVDGTITKSNVVMAFVIARLTELPFIVKIFWVPYFALNGLLYLILDRIDRALFNRVFYRNYQGRSIETKEAMAALIHQKYLKPKAFQSAYEHIKMLKAAGFRIVLVTGSLDFLIAPLATELGVDAVFAARLKEQDGRFTGELEGDAVSSKEKALLVHAYAEEHSVSLQDSHSYGDSIADLAMLEAVGHPFAVRPDPRLRKIAEERGWPILDWSTEGTAAALISGTTN